MAHGLRGFGLLLIVGSVGCTAPEKIAPQRLQLPPPQLPPSSPTAANKPANPPVDNRGQVKPAAAAIPTSDAPQLGQGPAMLPPATTAPNPATMPLSPGDSKVPGRGAPAIPTPTPPAMPLYSLPGMTNPTPPDVGAPPPMPVPAPIDRKPIEVPTMPVK